MSSTCARTRAATITGSPLLGVHKMRPRGPAGIAVRAERPLDVLGRGKLRDAQLEQTTDAVFAGEPDGRRPRRALGGAAALPLAPRVGVSTRYWQFAAPDDPRLTIDPDIAVPVTASDYFAGRDPSDGGGPGPIGRSTLAGEATINPGTMRPEQGEVPVFFGKSIQAIKNSQRQYHH